MEENISTFAGITGATADVARGFLEITSNDLERAIQLYFENPDLVSSVGAGVSGTGNTAASRQSATTTRHRVGTEDAEGVIHIPSDDDDDIMQIDDDDDDDQDFLDDSAGAGRVAARAQEEEDAAMAKRLQEELYQGGGGSSSGGGPEDVRAPIARTTETLVGPDPSWGGTDDGGAMEAAFLDQLRRRRNLPPRIGGPFGQRIWGDGNLPSPSSAENNSHARRLEDLFRPPYDLMARLTWDEARTLGKEDKKWILVNLQDMSDFNCQALNRDIWKDQAIKELISENFVFLQYDKEHPDAEDYINFYFHNREHENPDNYPHVSIIDPRTGEQVKIWSGRPFPSSIEFHAELAEFLDRYSLAANSKNPVAKTSAPKPKSVNVDRMTEDEMLEMALKNSLASRGDGGLSSGSGSTPNIVDPDSLTKPAELNSDDKGKEAEMPAEKSLFTQISSDKPHTEPANDPASTTRIQFRHPTGRVIRRFKLDDSIRTIFEWLKAEPLQGKEGIEFELKKMPQGQDLIESLDATIVDSGLKQGTVMIEFIED